MSFYPLLYEREITQKNLEKAIGKYVGASPAGNILVDPNTRRLLHVNKKKRNDSISDWNDVLNFPNTPRPKFIEFLQSKTDADINKVLVDIKKNASKKKDQAKGKAKQWVPLEIPEFPSGLTYGDFWDHQFDKYGDEIEKLSQDLDTEKKEKAKGKEYGKASAFETEYDIPENVTQFYADNGKGAQWAAFLKNSTSGKGKSVVGELNDLFKLMSEVVSGEVKSGRKYKVKKGLASVSLNSPEEIAEWKDDMLECIAKYTTKNIENINSDGTYQKAVPQKATKTLGFLGVLMNSEPSGMGRGEVLIAYVMEDAKFAGGGESFDITANGITYELKDYSDTGGGIRLGAHGGLTLFSWWKELEKTVKLTRDILEDLGPEKVESIIESGSDDKHMFQVWNLIASRKPYQDTREVGTAVDAGEVGAGKIATFKVFYGLMHEFLSRGKRDEQGKYTYAVLKGDDVKPETVEIDPISKEEVPDTEEIKVSYDKDDLLKFKELGSIKYIKDPLALQKDLDEIGKKYAEGTVVDYFMVFLPKLLSIDKLENFVFDTISQKAVKIISRKLRSSNKGEQHADKAFKKWKGQDEKSYYEVYHDVLLGEDEPTNESFYPQLFK